MIEILAKLLNYFPATITIMSAREHHHVVRLLQEFGQASDRYVESTGAIYGTHRTDMNALSIIINYEQRGLLPSPRDLSRELQLSSPATTAMLDRLEKLGMIERQRSDRDRRVIRIAMTSKARTKGREMFMPLGIKMLDILSGYDEEQLQVISKFMAEAVAGVDSAREEVVTQRATKPAAS